MGDRLPTFVACLGNATDPETFSGIPYHLVTAGRKKGIITAGLDLPLPKRAYKVRRAAWSLRSLATGGPAGGYQYSEAFLEALWNSWQPPTTPCTLINMFQLFPSRVQKYENIDRWFYIDQTLIQLFRDYVPNTPTQIQVDAIVRERQQYMVAKGILCHTHYAARSVIVDYDVSPDKVHVVGCGANLIESPTGGQEYYGLKQGGETLKLVFVGKDWYRKGLDRLVRSMAIAHKTGARIELHVIGLDKRRVPRSLRNTKHVYWHGFIDKKTEFRKFAGILRQCDYGCLLSRAEAGGISLLEFTAMGLPTIAPLVGGSAEFVIPGASNLLTPLASDDEVAGLIMQLAVNPDLVNQQRRAAFDQRNSGDWDKVVERLGETLGNSGG